MLYFCGKITNKYSRLSLSRIPRDSLKILRDIRTSTYQICRTEEKYIKQPHLTNICVIGLLDIVLSRILNILPLTSSLSYLYDALNNWAQKKTRTEQNMNTLLIINRGHLLFYSFTVNTVNVFIKCNENLNVFITRDKIFYCIH